jgi:hypothetical protein
MTAPAVHGNLFFREEAAILSGKYANYKNDRVVFYQDDYVVKDFTAYVCISLFRLGVVY